MSGADFNAILRRAAGREPAPAPERERDERPGGNFGLGRGGTASMLPLRRPASNALINERIRKGARIVRDVQLRNGLTLDLDDPWR